jgi:hypothetical protein
MTKYEKNVCSSSIATNLVIPRPSLPSPPYLEMAGIFEQDAVKDVGARPAV